MDLKADYDKDTIGSEHFELVDEMNKIANDSVFEGVLPGEH